MHHDRIGVRGTAASRQEAARLARLPVDTEANFVARRVTIQHEVASRVDRAEFAAALRPFPSLHEARRLACLTEAVGDLSHAILRGHDYDSELATLGAHVQAWAEWLAAEAAAA